MARFSVREFQDFLYSILLDLASIFADIYVASYILWIPEDKFLSSDTGMGHIIFILGYLMFSSGIFGIIILVAQTYCIVQDIKRYNYVEKDITEKHNMTLKKNARLELLEILKLLFSIIIPIMVTWESYTIVHKDGGKLLVPYMVIKFYSFVFTFVNMFGTKRDVWAKIIIGILGIVMIIFCIFSKVIANVVSPSLGLSSRDIETVGITLNNTAAWK